MGSAVYNPGKIPQVKLPPEVVYNNVVNTFKVVQVVPQIVDGSGNVQPSQKHGYYEGTNEPITISCEFEPYRVIIYKDSGTSYYYLNEKTIGQEITAGGNIRPVVLKNDGIEIIEGGFVIGKHKFINDRNLIYYWEAVGFPN